ncbi:MAG: RNA polymerase sigma factor region1.1 domain-containing protein, partial [Bdellovibrionota bacterium]
MTKIREHSPALEKAESGAVALNKSKEIKKLLDLGVQRGFLTYVEVNELLPLEVILPNAVDEIMNLLVENEIEVIDSAKKPKETEDDEEGADEAPLVVTAAATTAEAEAEEPVAATAAVAEYAKGADPVKLYLKKMGSVSLLTREGEVEIAKRIEEGEIEILRALLASKLGTLAIVDLGERLETGRTKIKDVIRGVDEEVSIEDEKAYLTKVLSAISKVKALVNSQEKLDEKAYDNEGKKLGNKKKEELQKELLKRERHVEMAFRNIAFNRKTINQLSAKIKGYWFRG